MTAEGLHRLFASTTDTADNYAAGRNDWSVDSKYGDVHLTLSETTGGSAVSFVRRLDDDDLDDLALALSKARAARETYRANDDEQRRNG